VRNVPNFAAARFTNTVQNATKCMEVRNVLQVHPYGGITKQQKVTEKK